VNTQAQDVLRSEHTSVAKNALLAREPESVLVRCGCTPIKLPAIVNSCWAIYRTSKNQKSQRR